MIDPQIKMKRGMLFISHADAILKYNGDTDAALTWKEVCTLVRPVDYDKEAWARFLPDAPLADTGSKVFKVGQVWATHTGSMPVVWSVTELHRDRAVPRRLAGFEESSSVDPGSVHAKYSVLLFDAPAESNQPAIPESSPKMIAADPVCKSCRRSPCACKLPVVPRGKDLDCTAHGCDRLRELGVYANRAGLCTMHVAEKTNESGGCFDPMGLRDATAENEAWAANIRREMRNRPKSTLIVGRLGLAVEAGRRVEATMKTRRVTPSDIKSAALRLERVNILPRQPMKARRVRTAERLRKWDYTWIEHRPPWYGRGSLVDRLWNLGCSCKGVWGHQRPTEIGARIAESMALSEDAIGNPYGRIP